MKPNTTLDATRIVNTIERLSRRIEERFPGSGLHDVSNCLHDLATTTERQAEAIDQPASLLRALTATVVAVVGACAAIAGLSLYAELSAASNWRARELVMLLEAGSNVLVLLGLAIFFVISLERRMKRHRALAEIHKLRAVAHVIDMHQLTKNPAQMEVTLIDTPSSPVRDMDPEYLVRYLDYCTELLSLTGKLAALYIQRFEDEITLTAANDVENLTTQLSRKIWQKVMIAEAVETRRQGTGRLARDN